METIPKNQTDLADRLGLSKGSVSTLAGRGMPTHSVEAAQAWREANLDPARRKGSRFDEHYKAASKPTPPLRSLVDQATELMALAGRLQDAGQPIDHLVPGLRYALSAVPKTERTSVGLCLGVMRLLLAPFLDRIPKDPDAKNDDGTPVYLQRELTDAEATEQGIFFYEVASGEWVFPQ